MDDKCLVAYGSWCGSTAEVAAEIGKVLAASGAAVDVLPVSEVVDLARYRAVVLGTAIRRGHCKGEVLEFSQRHRDALRSVPLALFSVGAQLHEDTPENRARAESFVTPLRALVRPLSFATLAGAVDPERVPLPARLIAKRLPRGDWRDWDAIRDWASTLPRILEAC